MPIARFQLPDGRVARFEVPEGTTPEQANAMMGEHFKQPDSPVKQGTSIPRTILDQTMQGATFGFSDEISDRVGALIAASMTGGKYDDFLNEARSGTKQRLVAQQEENPVTSILSNIAGGVGTGLAGTSTKLGAKIAGSLGAGGLPMRIAKGAATGAASGAAYGAGTSEDRLEGAGQGAVLGGLVGGAVPAVGSALSSVKEGSKTALRGLSARTPDALDDAAKGIKAKSSALYKQARDAGVVFKPESMQNLLDDIDKSLTSSGKLNARLHGDTLSIVDELKTAVKQNDFGLEELDQYRQLLGDVVSKNTDIKGANPDAMKALSAIDTIDDAINKISGKDIIGGDDKAIGLLKEGRKEWRKFRKFESISNIIKNADGDPNKIKSGLTRFINKPKNLRGFNQEEIKALKIAAQNSKPEKIFKALGRFGIDAGNVFLPVVSGGLGAISGVSAPTAVLVGTGTVTRQLNKLLGRAKAEEVLKLIESGNTQAIQQIVKPKQLTKIYSVLGLTSQVSKQEAVK